MVASIIRMLSPLNFLLSQIWFVTTVPKYLYPIITVRHCQDLFCSLTNFVYFLFILTIRCKIHFVYDPTMAEAMLLCEWEIFVSE
jgi:hypothetical protein